MSEFEMLELLNDYSDGVYVLGANRIGDDVRRWDVCSLLEYGDSGDYEGAVVAFGDTPIEALQKAMQVLRDQRLLFLTQGRK